MAIKSTIHKAELRIADIGRGVYVDRSLTVARHPSETDERMMVRLLAYALHVPADEADGALELAKGLSDTDEPDLWRKDLTGRIVHWIEVGQPDDRRIVKACGRADRVSVLAYASSWPVWWSGARAKLARAGNLDVTAIDADETGGLARLARRGMRLQFTMQDGTVWVSDDRDSVELRLRPLMPAEAAS